MPVSSRDVLVRLDRRIRGADARPSSGAPVHPHPATSVVLLRDVDDRLETYVLHRHVRMAFAAGMVVFPGGRWDPADGEPRPALGLADPARLTCGIRETREETGVRLDPDGLHAWAHWITPEHEPRRYDTAFYLAALPDRQCAIDISGEAWKAEWRSPADVLAAADRHELALMPPTRSILLELADLAGVDAALAACRHRLVETVLPRILPGPDGCMFGYDR